MRLAVISPFVDRSHGTERALAELLERLARRHDCEIHLYSQRVQDLSVDRPSVSRTGNSGTILWHKVPTLPGPHLVRFVGWLAANSIMRWLGTLSGRAPFDLVISPGINALNADVVFVHVLFQRLQEIAEENKANRHARTKLFYRIHRRLYYRMLAALERQIYRDRNVLLSCVSRRTAGLLAKYFERHDVRIVPNGIDTAQFSPSARLARRTQARTSRKYPDRDFVLLLLGNDWAMKGVPVILSAMSSLATLPLHLLVVGTDVVEPFRELADSLNVSSRFHWEPPRQDVMDFYAAADIYVSPSKEDSFGLPVLEAMACGLPVITSTFAGVSELISDERDGCVLRDPMDVEALARKLHDVYSDASLRKRIGEAAAATAKNWTWDRNAADIWELLKDAAEKKMAAATAVR